MPCQWAVGKSRLQFGTGVVCVAGGQCVLDACAWVWMGRVSKSFLGFFMSKGL